MKAYNIIKEKKNDQPERNCITGLILTKRNWERSLKGSIYASYTMPERNLSARSLITGNGKVR